MKSFFIIIFSLILSVTISYSSYKLSKTYILKHNTGLLMSNNIENNINLKNFIDGTIPW